MINLITGTPGAGKSYLAVSLLVENYFNYKYGEYTLKDEFKDYTIITNIEGLQLEHKSLDEILSKIPFDTFFTKDYQDKLSKKYPKIIYVIDECQRYIPPRYRNENVIFYFDYHRHYDHVIYLISQDSRKICKEIALLHEIEYRAVKAMFQSFGFFQYLIKSNWEICGRKTIRQKKQIFELYKSFNTPGQKNKGLRNKIPIYCIILLIAGFGLYKLTFASLQGSGDKAMESQEQQLRPNSSSTQLIDSRNNNQSSTSRTQNNQDKPPPGRPAQVKLRDVMAIYNNDGSPTRLIAFRCPLTSEMTYPNKIHYRIIVRNNEFYASLHPLDYDYTSLAYTRPTPPDKDQHSANDRVSRPQASENPTTSPINQFRSQTR